MRYKVDSLLSLTILTAINLFNYLDRYVLASVLPPIKTELRLGDGEIGWLASVFMVGYFASSPLFGYLGDNWRRKGLIAFGVTSWSFGTMACALCEDYWSLVACRVLIGLGEASYATLAPAWLADLFPSPRRNLALTIFYAAIPLGSALGYVVGGLALAHGGWRAGFLWAGAPGLVLALALIGLREPARGESEPRTIEAASAPSAIGRIFGLFRIGDFNLILAGYTAYTFALGAFAAWGPTFLNRTFGIELGLADKFFGGVLVVAGLFGTLIGGFVGSVLQRRTGAGYAFLLVASMVLTAPMAAIALLAKNATLSMSCLAAAMFLAFLPTGPIATLLIESVPVRLRASAMAASIFVIHLFGDFWSPAIVGMLADRYADAAPSAIGLQQALLILPEALGLSVLLWGWLALRQQRRALLQSALLPQHQ